MTEFNIDIAKEVWQEEAREDLLIELAEKDAVLAAKDDELAAKDTEIAAKDDEIRKFAILVAELQAKLDSKSN